MSAETHRARHMRLHDGADELGADYLKHHPNAQLDAVSFLAVLKWSGEQARMPTEPSARDKNGHHDGVHFDAPVKDDDESPEGGSNT